MKKKKELIFFANTMCIGGIENALVELLNRINYSKYNVTLVLGKIEGDNLVKINNQVNVREYRICNSKNIIYRKFKNFVHYMMWYFLNHNKYSFSCNYATYLNWGSKLAISASKNSSIYVHSDYYNALKNEPKYIKFFENLNIYKFKSIFFVSNESKNKFCNCFDNLSSNCYVINNFINEQKIIDLSKENIDDIKTNKKLLVFVGRLDESSKKISKLIECLKYLNDKNMDVGLWIIGDGPDKELYYKMIDDYNLSSYVKMFGMKKNPYPYMKKADYIILTSKYEGFPVIYLEAILLNKRIITTVDVSDDFISIKNRFGHIIEQQQEKLEKSIESILKHDDLKYEKINLTKNDIKKMLKLESIFDNEY